MITKSGTNDLHGNALFNFQGDQLSGGAVPAEGFTDVFGTGIPSLRINPLNSDLAEYITYPEDKVSRIEPGFALGGPIVTNRAWFFGAYQPTFTSIERTVNATTASNPAGRPNSATRKRQEQYITANLTGQMSDSLRGRVAFNNSWRQSEGPAADAGRHRSGGLRLRQDVDVPELLGVGQHGLGRLAEPVLRHPRRLLHVGLARHERDGGSTLQLDDHEQHRFPGRAGQPAAPDRVLERALEQQVVKDQQTRANFQADGTVYGKLGGDHQLKFGVSFDRLGNNVDSGEAAARVTIRWNQRPHRSTRGAYGYYSVRSAGPTGNLKKGFTTSGDVSSNLIGLFVQDAWTINNKLTINAGIRTERERVPYYAPGQVVDGVTLPEFGLEFDFADKLAPRAGFAYDINGDGRWKAFGSWGVFYDIFKLELPRGSFGGDKWIEYYYTLDTLQLADPRGQPGVPAGLPRNAPRGRPTSVTSRSGPTRSIRI